MDVYDQVKHRLRAPTLDRKFDISQWFLCGADGRTDSLVITKHWRIDGLSNFLKYGATLVRTLRARGASLK